MTAASFAARRGWVRAGLTLAALGATLGVALDAIHSHFGATAYAAPVVWRTAWWVPPLFAGAFTIGLLRPLLDRLLPTGPLPGARAVIAAFGLFVAAYWVTVAPLPWPAVVAALLVLFAAAWWIADRSPAGLALAALAAAGGPAVEALLIALGLFRHLHEPLALGVPHWLPFLYLCASAALGPLARRLVAD
jgi:hypothetical protein